MRSLREPHELAHPSAAMFVGPLQGSHVRVSAPLKSWVRDESITALSPEDRNPSGDASRYPVDGGPVLGDSGGTTSEVLRTGPYRHPAGAAFAHSLRDHPNFVRDTKGFTPMLCLQLKRGFGLPIRATTMYVDHLAHR